MSHEEALANGSRQVLPADSEQAIKCATLI